MVVNPKSLGALIVSSAGVQALSACSALILLRFYTPAEFGHYSLCVGIGTILAVVLAGRLELAIALPFSKTRASQIHATGRAFVGAGAMITTIALSIGAVFHLWEFATAAFGLVIGVLTAAIQLDTATLNRDKKFASVASLRFAQALSIACIQIGLVLFVKFSYCLEIGNILALVFSAIIFRRKRLQAGYVSPIRFHKRALACFQSFYLIDIWSALLNSFSSQMPILLLGKMFSVEVVGYYSLAHRLLMLPVSLVGANLAQVFYQEASALSRIGELSQRSFKKPMFLLVILGLTTLVPLAVFAPQLIAIVFGQGWEVSGKIIRIIMPWIFVTLVISPFLGVFNIRGQQSFFLISNIILFLLRLAVFVLSFLIFRNWEFCLASYSAISVLFWIYMLIMILQEERKCLT